MKIAIVGTAPHCVKAPFSDPSWEIWGCNLPGDFRWDRWFQLHGDEVIDGNPGHREWLVAQTKRIYLQKDDPAIPMGMAYPLARMREKYGDWFFSSTIAFMLATAIEENPEEIGLWGVDMSDETEYRHQKPGCRFFIQIARMAGIKVTAPPESEILVPGRIYSYPDDMDWLRMKAAARRKDLESRAQQHAGYKDSLIIEKLMLNGALQLTLPKADMEKRLAEIAGLEAHAERTSLVLDGALQDIAHIEANWTGEHL